MDDELDYQIFQNKRPDRVYLSPSIANPTYQQGADGEPELVSKPVRIVSKILDGKEDAYTERTGCEVVLRERRRFEIRAKFYEDSRDIRVLTIQKYSTTKGYPLPTYFSFIGAEIETLYNFVRNIALLPLDEKGSRRLEDSDVAALRLSSAQAFRILQDHPEVVEALTKNSVTAGDIHQLGYRRAQLEEFDRLLHNDAYFDEEARKSNGPESVWQKFFEANTWIFGYGLDYFLNTKFNDGKLERAVVGHNFEGSGKRVDALLRTRGFISSISFGEIKTHRTTLLKKAPYREESWPVSDELAGGVAQVQRTVQKALEKIHTHTKIKDEHGNPTGEQVYMYQPKAFLVVGSLSEFQAGNEINEDKFSSFELFRRSVGNPDILTFDELFERARYIVEAHNMEASSP